MAEQAVEDQRLVLHPALVESDVLCVTLLSPGNHVLSWAARKCRT
jgi:hypothetical protein